MKYYNYTIPLLFLALSTIVSAQDGTFLEVEAVRVAEAFAEPYQTGKYQVEGFTIDKEMALRPVKGYRLWVGTKTSKFRITSATLKKDSALAPSTNFDVEPIPGGYIWCMCNSLNDDCKVIVSPHDNELNYGCISSGCSCLALLESDNPVVAYQGLGTRDWITL